MNYFEHHIRDYDAATSHLTWLEDMAYTRLLRLYYRKEEPIPADVKEACRLVRAVSKPERDAVAAVLKEFFDLRADGWHKDYCDEIIAEYKAGEPEREVKRANEENRSKRHRDERADLFRKITAAGGHLPWNIGIKELREAVANLPDDPTSNAPVTVNASQVPKPVTRPVTAPVTPVTATHSPLPTPHSPIPNLQESKTGGTDRPAVNPANGGSVGPPAGGPPDDAQPRNGYSPGDVSRRLSEIGITWHRLNRAPDRERMVAWCDAGCTSEILEEAIVIASQSKPVTELSTGYLDPVVMRLIAHPEAGNGTYDFQAELAKALELTQERAQ